MNDVITKVSSKSYIAALAVSTVVYFVSIRFFQDWYYKLAGLDQRPAGLFSSFGEQFFRAEPLEIYLYFIGFLVVPVLAFLFLPLLQNIKIKISFKIIIVSLALIGFGLGVFIITRFPLDFVFNYLETKGLSQALWLLTTKRLVVAYIVFGVSVLFFFTYYHFEKPKSVFKSLSNYEEKFKKLAPFGLGLLAILLYHPNLPIDPHHYNYFLGAVNDIYQGKGLLYESSHLYGLFNIYFLAVFFKIFPFSFAFFSLLITFSFYIFFVGIYFFIKKWLDSYFLAMLGTGVIVSIMYFFQTSPTRSVLFFPNMSPFRLGMYVVVPFLILAFQKTKKKKWLHLSLVISAFAIFWNFDSGLFLGISTVSVFGYFFVSSSDVKSAWRVAVWYVAYAVFFFVVINIFNFFFYGYYPNWALFFRETSHFVQGAGMYPLPGVGIYQIFFFTYLVTILFAVRDLIYKKSFDLPLLFLALYGSLASIYYVGESTWQLLYVITVPFVLILIYAFKKHRDVKIVRAGFLALVVFSGLLFAFKVPVEFVGRDYTTAATDLTGIPKEDIFVFEDAQYIKRQFDQKRIPLVARIQDDYDTKLLLYAEKANYYDFYYTFTVYFEEEMQKYIDQTLAEGPEFLFIGNEPNDQVEYFINGVVGRYSRIESLNTLDIYQKIN